MKTTKQHFEIFKKECQKWIEIFGLKNWEIDYYHKKDKDESLSWVSFNHDNRCANIYLGIEWPDNIHPTNYEVRKSAFHEITEILLHPIRYIGDCRYVNGPEEIEVAVHNVIRVLENTLWNKY